MAVLASCFGASCIPSDIPLVTRWQGLDSRSTPQSDLEELGTEFFSPDYLFSGPRPTIDGSPVVGDYGNQIAISTPDANVHQFCFSGAADGHNSPLRRKSKINLAQITSRSTTV